MNTARIQTIPHTQNDRQEASTCPYRLVDSQQLLQGQDLIYIQHRDTQYCLRETKQGKLILTK